LLRRFFYGKPHSSPVLAVLPENAAVRSISSISLWVEAEERICAKRGQLGSDEIFAMKPHKPLFLCDGIDKCADPIN
jgi:hypothetical protein